MVNFDIIGVFEEYALERNWNFVYGVNQFERNIHSIAEFEAGQLIFMCDFRISPTIRDGVIQSIDYTCLMMLGRKVDPDMEVSNLGETNKQKYDRRIRELSQILTYMISEIECNNDLIVSVGDIVVELNLYDENIDFATAAGVTYTHEL